MIRESFHQFKIEVIEMRAPFQVITIPYKIIDKSPLFCIFYRADIAQWQFIAGGCIILAMDSK